jgi:hypothetical protein
MDLDKELGLGAWYNPYDLVRGAKDKMLTWTNGLSNEEVARWVLKNFIEEAKPIHLRVYGEEFPYSVADLFAFYEKKNQIDWIADPIKMADVTRGTIEDAMANLAEQGQGKFPEHANAFVSAITGEATDSPWLDVMVDAQNIVKGGADVVSSTAKGYGQVASNIGKYFPYILGLTGVLAVGYLLTGIGRSGVMGNK